MLHHVELAELGHVAPDALLTGLDRHAGIERDTPPRLKPDGLERLDFPARPPDRVGIAAVRGLGQRR